MLVYFKSDNLSACGARPLVAERYYSFNFVDWDELSTGETPPPQSQTFCFQKSGLCYDYSYRFFRGIDFGSSLVPVYKTVRLVRAFVLQRVIIILSTLSIVTVALS